MRREKISTSDVQKSGAFRFRFFFGFFWRKQKTTKKPNETKTGIKNNWKFGEIFQILREFWEKIGENFERNLKKLARIGGWTAKKFSNWNEIFAEKEKKSAIYRFFFFLSHFFYLQNFSDEQKFFGPKKFSRTPPWPQD